MNKVDLTPAKLAELRQKAEAAADSPWIADRLKVVRLRPSDSDDPTDEVYQVAACECLWDAEHIAAANPATVLAMVEEIEILKTALNLLMCEYYSTDLEHEDIDKLCIAQIEIAKKHRKSEAGQ